MTPVAGDTKLALDVTGRRGDGDVSSEGASPPEAASADVGAGTRGDQCRLRLSIKLLGAAQAFVSLHLLFS